MSLKKVWWTKIVYKLYSLIFQINTPCFSWIFFVITLNYMTKVVQNHDCENFCTIHRLQIEWKTIEVLSTTEAVTA